MQLKNFLMEEEGLTTVEYAIAGALVGAAVIAAFQALGIEVGATVTNITTTLTNARAPEPDGSVWYRGMHSAPPRYHFSRRRN